MRDQVPSFKTSAAFRRELSLTPPADGAPLPADYALTADELIGVGCAMRIASTTCARRWLTAQLGAAGLESASPLEPLSAAFAHHTRREDDIELLGAASAALGIGRGQPTEPLVLVRYCLRLEAAREPRGLRRACRVTADHAYTAPALISLPTRRGGATSARRRWCSSPG